MLPTIKTSRSLTDGGVVAGEGEAVSGYRPKWPRRLRERRPLRPFVLSVALAVMAFFAIDGPVFVTQRATPPLPASYAELEERFSTLLADTEVVIVDTQTLTSRDPIEAYVADRLNARGIFVNAAWASFIDRVADPAYGARAIWRSFLGGRHGNGLMGYMRAWGVCVVTTGTEARRLATHPGGSEAFWARLIVVHELQHCVDADRGNLSEPGTMDLVVPRRVQRSSADAPLHPRISGRELYADAAATLYLLRDGASLDVIDQFIDLRARPVMTALAQRQPPVWTHFTAPMLQTVVADVEHGDIVLGRLSDDDIHNLAVRYRDKALADAAKVSLSKLRTAMQDTTSRPKTILRQTGAPSVWLALATRPPTRPIPSLARSSHPHGR